MYVDVLLCACKANHKSLLLPFYIPPKRETAEDFFLLLFLFSIIVPIIIVTTAHNVIAITAMYLISIFKSSLWFIFYILYFYFLVYYVNIVEEVSSMKVFLGGTTNNSNWREKLIPLLKINYFNPVVKNWTEKCYQEELKQRKSCDFCLYVLTPLAKGMYSVAEAIDDSNKRPEKTVFCLLKEDSGKKFDKAQFKSLEKVALMVKKNGGTVCATLEDVAEFLNHGKEASFEPFDKTLFDKPKLSGDINPDNFSDGAIEKSTKDIKNRAEKFQTKAPKISRIKGAEQMKTAEKNILDSVEKEAGVISNAISYIGNKDKINSAVKDIFCADDGIKTFRDFSKAKNEIERQFKGDGAKKDVYKNLTPIYFNNKTNDVMAMNLKNNTPMEFTVLFGDKTASEIIGDLLEKEAAEKEKNNVDGKVVAGAAAGTGGVIGGVKIMQAVGDKGLLDGRRKLYHSTGKENVESILREGIKASKANGSDTFTKKVSELGNLNLAGDELNNLIYLGKNKKVADEVGKSRQVINATKKVLDNVDPVEHYLHPERANGQILKEYQKLKKDSKTLKASIPFGEYKKFDIRDNPELLGAKTIKEYVENREKINAAPAPKFAVELNFKRLSPKSTATIKGDLDAQFLKDSDSYLKNSLSQVRDYIKENPGRFAKGVGTTLGAAALTAGGAYAIKKSYDRYKNNKLENEQKTASEAILEILEKEAEAEMTRVIASDKKGMEVPSPEEKRTEHIDDLKTMKDKADAQFVADAYAPQQRYDRIQMPIASK